MTALVSCLEETGNPFLEESSDILSLYTKDVADSAIRKTVEDIKQIGQEQFDTFVEERLFHRTKPLYDSMPGNKLVLFNSHDKTTVSKDKIELALAMTLFYFPNCISDVSIGVVMWMNSLNTKTKPSHHLCPTLDNYDSLPNQHYLPVLKHLLL